MDHLVVLGVDILAVQHDLGVGLLVAVDGVDKRGLACAGAAQQQHQVALGDGHVDIPKQYLLLEGLDDGAVLQVYRQALVHDRGAALVNQLRQLGLDVIHLPAGLVLLVEAPDQRGDEVQVGRNPQPQPALLLAVDLHDARADADGIDEVYQLQAGDKAQQRDVHRGDRGLFGVGGRIKKTRDVQGNEQHFGDGVFRRVRFTAGAAGEIEFTQAGNQRMPVFDAGLREHHKQTQHVKPDKNDAQAFV